MKKRSKKLAAIGLTCAMVVGMSITAGAADRSALSEHACEYHLAKRDYVIQGYAETSHPYGSDMKTCYVSVLRIGDMYECAHPGCGNRIYFNERTINRHYNCGMGDQE